MTVQEAGREKGRVGRTWSGACLLAAALLAAGSAGAWPPAVGDVPANRLGTTSTGERVKLADYRGKVVVVTFWASWCSPCRKELSILGGIQKQATTDKLQVLAVNYAESADRYRQIVKVLTPALNNAPIKLISDEDGYYGRQYGVKGIPHMVIIGRDGRIVSVHEGYGEDRIPVLVNQLNSLLAEPVEKPSPQQP